MGATMPGVRKRVLIVDDHEPFRAVARELLERAGYIVTGEAAGAARLSRQSRPRLLTSFSSTCSYPIGTASPLRPRSPPRTDLPSS